MVQGVSTIEEGRSILRNASIFPSKLRGIHVNILDQLCREKCLVPTPTGLSGRVVKGDYIQALLAFVSDTQEIGEISETDGFRQTLQVLRDRKMVNLVQGK
jgi:hypothetical protein